jgi:hypothetical protein
MRPTRRVKPPAFKPSSLLLASKDHLEASDAMPPELVRSAIYVSTSGGALLTNSELVSTSIPLVAFTDAGSGPSSTVRQTPPVSLLMENLSSPKAPASQARLDVLEPSDFGSPVQAHKIRSAIDGSSLGLSHYRNLSWLVVLPFERPCLSLGRRIFQQALGRRFLGLGWR